MIVYTVHQWKCVNSHGAVTGQRHPGRLSYPSLAWALPGSSCHRGDLHTPRMWGNNMRAGEYWWLLWTSHHQFCGSLWRKSLGLEVYLFFLFRDSNWWSETKATAVAIYIFQSSFFLLMWFFASWFFTGWSDFTFKLPCQNIGEKTPSKYPSLAFPNRGGYSKVMSGDTSVLSCCEAGCFIPCDLGSFFQRFLT